MFVWGPKYESAINYDKIICFKINHLDEEKMVLPINRHGEECKFELVAILTNETRVVCDVFKTLESAQKRLAEIIYSIDSHEKQKLRT